jgi:hypothetical protein
MSEETYSDNAFDKSLLFLSSFIYFNTDDAKKDKNSTTKN